MHISVYLKNDLSSKSNYRITRGTRFNSSLEKTLFISTNEKLDRFTISMNAYNNGLKKEKENTRGEEMKRESREPGKRITVS